MREAVMARDDESPEYLTNKKRKTEASSLCTSASPTANDPYQKRIVCDNCRSRRVRCDGEFPCQRCQYAKLTCKRDHVPRKRGPKPGHGKVIDGIRARDEHGEGHTSPPSEPKLPPNGEFHGVSNGSSPAQVSHPSPWTTSPSSATHSSFDGEPFGPFSTDQLRPNMRHHFDMIPKLVDLYYEHIYPIMPLVYMPTISEIIGRPMSPPEKRQIYALCALTAFHMSGKSINAAGPASTWEAASAPPAWEQIGRSFLDESISARQSYDFEEDISLPAITASFWMSTSFFEINQSKKSWYYLKEALSLAMDLGLHNEAKYMGLSDTEKLCRRRVFWILFVTERSFAILRRKPLTFTRTPSLPTTTHDYEAPDIHAGFLKLVASYTPLDTAFVNAWNDEASDPSINRTAFMNLQDTLALAPTSPTTSPVSTPGPGGPPDPDDPEPTTIQKADLLMTQQWLRLIVWQASLRQGLLSSHAEHPSMRFSFPLSVAHDTVAVLSALPPKAVEVHGMGIFEKIFEIASTCLNVMGACETNGFGAPFAAAGGSAELLGLVKKQPLNNPVEFFIGRLSASENSKTMFANKLLMLSRENPAAIKLSLSPTLPMTTIPEYGKWQHQLQAPTSNPTGLSLDLMCMPAIKAEPGTEDILGVEGAGSAYTPPILPAQTQTQARTQLDLFDPMSAAQSDAGEAEPFDEEIERASNVCYANQFLAVASHRIPVIEHFVDAQRMATESENYHSPAPIAPAEWRPAGRAQQELPENDGGFYGTSPAPPRRIQRPRQHQDPTTIANYATHFAV
ncbi:RING-3 protein [Zalerion maritima]|uniref:RING-3 protein n=1 Tax=Zalerion maritima TaxID=339359 RepID=A0AAD5RP72_9PEZI|nr:RING-3 protein [Zalerion maritima]